MTKIKSKETNTIQLYTKMIGPNAFLNKLELRYHETAISNGGLKNDYSVYVCAKYKQNTY